MHRRRFLLAHCTSGFYCQYVGQGSDGRHCQLITHVSVMSWHGPLTGLAHELVGPTALTLRM